MVMGIHDSNDGTIYNEYDEMDEDDNFKIDIFALNPLERETNK